MRVMLLLSLLLVSCATTNVVPGVSVGGTAAVNGDLSATVTVSPEGLICTVLGLLNLDDLCPPGAAETKPAPVAGVPTARVWTPADPVALRCSVFAPRMTSVPCLASPIAPTRYYGGHV